MSTSAAEKRKMLPFAEEIRLFYSFRVYQSIVYLAAATVSFFILSASFQAAAANYFQIYTPDARVEIKNEVDITDEIKIAFNQPVIFFGAENMSIYPKTEFGFYLSGEGKLLAIKPKTGFLPETKYEFELINIRGLSGLAMENKKFVFYTKAEQSLEKFEFLSEEESDLLFAEFELSKDKCIPAEILQPKADIDVEPKFKEGRYIDINIANQTMTLFENGVEMNSFLISSGKPGMPTPLGTFSVRKKEENHWSSSYGLWMPYSMNFYSSFYIHELPYWPSGYREGENHLGTRVSHGCVRLGIGSAEYVYNWADIGTPVYVHK